MSDRFIEETPFFTDGHRHLATYVEDFVAQQIEGPVREAGATDEQFRQTLALLAEPPPSLCGRPAGHPRRARPGLVRRRSHIPPLADLAFVMQGLGTYAISLAAPEHVRDFWLERAATGRTVAAFALTEPEAGSDVASLRTTARRDGDSYVIDGRKCFISNAGIADFYTLCAHAHTRAADGRAELSAFASARGAGFAVRARTE